MKLLRHVKGELESAQSFAMDVGLIVAIYSLRNFDKLASVPRHLS